MASCPKGAVGLVVVLAVVGFGCGKKEPPKPPASRLPAAVTDLTVQQLGSEIILELTYPTTTVGGLALDQIEIVQVWEVKRSLPPSAPEEEEPPRSIFYAPTEADTEDDQQQLLNQLMRMDPMEFGPQARLRLTLQGQELSAAVTGNRLKIRLPLGELIDGEDEVLILGVRPLIGRRLISAFSNLAGIAPRQPPSPPTSLAVVPQGDGVHINWESDEDASGFRIYRRLAQNRAYGSPIHFATPETQEYVDRSARFGNQYIYAVTTVVSVRPAIESAIAIEREVNYEDRFAPASPENLLALPEPGRVQLLWEASSADDLAGYLVLRREGEGSLERLTSEPIPGLEFLDDSVFSGRSYSYAVIAVDRVGNESNIIREIDILVP